MTRPQITTALEGTPSISHRHPRVLLVGILLTSLGLNLWGSQWGLPERWHPDELTEKAIEMVEQRTLNPHYFAYGNLHYYQVMAAAVAPVKAVNKTLDLWDSRQDERSAIIWCARALSAVLGAGVVLLVFLMGSALFGRAAGLWSAALLAVSMGLVNLSHYATTELASIFWFTAACVCSTYVLLRPERRWSVLAGLCTGFAAGVKYIGGIAVIPLLAAHVMGRRSRSRLVVGVAMAVAGFLLANPVVLFSFFEFARGFLKESAFNAARNDGSARVFVPLLGRLVNALGLPLFLCAVAGALYSLRLLRTGAERAKVLLVWTMILPHYLLMGSLHVSLMRYIVPVVPALLVFAGKLAADLLRAKPQEAKVFASVALGLTLSYSLVYSVAAALTFTSESRYQAAAWVERHVAPGSTIEVTSNSPNLPRRRYRIVQRPHDVTVTRTAAIARDRATSGWLAGLISWMEAKRDRTDGAAASSASYTAWYEHAQRDYQQAAAAFDVGLKGLERRGPDYLIVSSLYYNRFAGDRQSAEGQLFDALFDGRTNYRQVAEFTYQFHPWINPVVERTNPTIRIFRFERARQRAESRHDG